MRSLRYVFALVAGFLASLLAGVLGYSAQEFMGRGTWFAWAVSGAASAVAFFALTYKLAPARPPALKWTLVATVASLGLISALGSLLAGREPVSALAGVAMIACAAAYAREGTPAPQHPPPPPNS
jgi:uncharacterized BrkB/YihY/UPF0761 family membrane protein